MATEEDILAIYINLINMVVYQLSNGLHLFLRNYYKKRKIYKIYCFCRQMANAKLLKGNRLLANPLPIYSFKFTLTLVLIN